MRGWIRTLHLYVTLLGLGLMLFFSLTGLLLNHEEWLVGEPAVVDAEATLPPEKLQKPDRAEIERWLRTEQGAKGRVTSYVVDEDLVEVAFRAPGWRTDATITREDGAAQVRHEKSGALGRLADLHKGAEAGWAWKRVIDATALVLLASSISGLFLWTGMQRRRVLGLILVGLGLVVAAAVYFAAVP